MKSNNQGLLLIAAIVFACSVLFFIGQAPIDNHRAPTRHINIDTSNMGK